MNYEYAIRVLKEERKFYESDYCTPGDGTPDGTLLAAIDEGIAGLEMRTAKKPDYEADGYDNNGELIYDTWICPNCEKRYEVDCDSYDYCPNCGQAIDWSDRNE